MKWSIHLGRMLGIDVFLHVRLVEVLRERGEWTFVAEAMEREFHTLRPDEPADRALFQAEPGRSVLPVVRDGRLVDLLTAENVGELLMIRAARRQHSTEPPPLPRDARTAFHVHN